ncbi:L-serine dehydratase [Tolypocladium paradoxum]|uniref:L-serine ammonia-lyase n=1 Tax=Tolypocladium paradoxum TaxID=94208 RepID=A0A2S4KTN1_9HYPO|nr:L-serine dehydratase [Tolypocladium paradoxum]
MKPVALMLLAGAALAAAKPTVYFIRHGEKPSDADDDALSARGKLRAQCLRKVFGAGSQYDIGHIMAQRPGSHGSRRRPYDTVAPLASDLGIRVDTSCHRDDRKCVKDVVEGYSGSGNILICWEHKRLKHLAKALGAKGVEKYPSGHFDIIWTDPPPYKKIVDVTFTQPSHAALARNDGLRRQSPVDRNASRKVCHALRRSWLPSGSFKSRGIGNFMAARLEQLRDACGAHAEPHFYSSSGGNAGLACVHAAVTLGCRATVVVPLSTTAFVVAKLRQAGAADVMQRGASWHEADSYLTGTVMAEARARGEAAVYVPPFDAPDIWDGNAGISREIARQIGDVARHYPVSSGPRCNGDGVSGNGARCSMGDVDAIVCSVGGGGLFSGVMQGLDELQVRRTRVIAVETRGADSLSQAVAKKALVTLPAITSLATSLGASTVCEKALEYALRDTVSTVVLPDSEAISACRRFADEERFLVELACGVCPALCYNGRLAELVPGFSKDSVVVLVICGGSNMSLDIMDKYTTSQAAEPKA